MADSIDNTGQPARKSAIDSPSELSGSMKALRDFPKPTESLARILAQQSAAARSLSELSGSMKALRDFRKPTESLARILAQQSAAARPLSELSGLMKALRDFRKPAESLARILAQQSAAAPTYRQIEQQREIHASRPEVGIVPTRSATPGYPTVSEFPIVKNHANQTNAPVDEIEQVGAAAQDFNGSAKDSGNSAGLVALIFSFLLFILQLAYTELYRAPRDAAALEDAIDTVQTEFESLSETLNAEVERVVDAIAASEKATPPADDESGAVPPAAQETQPIGE